MEDFLKKNIWCDLKHPAGFSGPEKNIVSRSRKRISIGRFRITQFLNNQVAYSLQKPVQRKFTRSRMIVEIGF
jgi:hypothetical protein